MGGFQPDNNSGNNPDNRPDHGTNLRGDDLAQACARAMWENDRVPKGLGIKLGAISRGRAQLTMAVRDDMTNGINICHGGYLFTLADVAFSYACNTYNQICVAQHCSINYLKSATIGEMLTATAIERVREGRTGIYDITIINQAGETIAEFRGTSRTIKGKLLPQNAI